MSMLNFEPLISPTLWVTMCLLTVALLAWYGWSRPASVTRRRWIAIMAFTAAGLTAVLVVLLNPTWLEPIPPPAGKPLLTVLVDTSASMAIDDADGGKTRYQAAAEIAATMPDELASRFDVRVQTFAASTSMTDVSELAAVKPTGESTDLAASLAESLQADRPQGQALMLLSDGIHNAPGGIRALLDVVRTAKAMAVPVYTKTLGGDPRIKDLEVTLSRPQELTFVGQTIPITVRIRQRGALAETVNVALLLDGEEVDNATAGLTPDTVSTVRFNVNRESSGLYHFEVRAGQFPAETTAANNSAAFLLRVVDDPIRVLLLEGKPYWDAKFVMRTLASDPALELDCVVRLREGRFLKRSLKLIRPDKTAEIATEEPANRDAQSPTAPDPVQRVESTSILSDPSIVLEDLETYQVVVLGRESEIFLSDTMLERLRNWIARDGGSLVCYRGSPVASVDQALARLMPVRWKRTRESRFRIQLTDRGQNLSWLAGETLEGGDDVLAKLPSLVTAANPERPKPLAVVLARSEGQTAAPVVTYQSYGTGRVVAVEGAGMWRWAFLPPQYGDHDAVYGSLWQSLLRWLVSSVGLVPGQDFLLRTDKVSYTASESVSATLLVREETRKDAIPAIELSAGDSKSGKTFKPVPVGDEPGVYRILFGRLPQGRYRAAVLGGAATQKNSARTVAFDVRPYLGEQLDVKARPDIMARIARGTDGAVLEDAGPAAVAARFREHIAKTRPQRVRRLSAWDRWWLLIAVFALWGTAWGLRRAGGLV